MSVLDLARKDVQRIITGVGNANSSILITTPGGTISKTLLGLAVKIHAGFDDMGKIVSSKTARVTLSEQKLTALGYPVRDSNNEVNLINHRVTWADVSGTVWTYVIKENYPDETLGNIVCQLVDYKSVPNPPKKIIYYKSAVIYGELVASNPTGTQTLDNGDVIPLQYVPNLDGTLTIPYTIGLSVLTPFMLSETPIQDMPFNKTTGTFDNSLGGGFYADSKIAFNASIPFYLQ